MTATAWPVLPLDELPRDPWPHEHGEDPGHLLDPSGHQWHAVEAEAHLVGEPRPVVLHVHEHASPAATYLISSEVLAFVVVALMALAGTLPGLGS
jgi:hypothetical protein